MHRIFLLEGNNDSNKGGNFFPTEEESEFPPIWRKACAPTPKNLSLFARVAHDDAQTTYSLILSTMRKLDKKRQQAGKQVRNALLQLWQSDSMPEKSGWFSAAQFHSLFCSAGADISKAILSNALAQMKPTVTSNEIKKKYYTIDIMSMLITTTCRLCLTNCWMLEVIILIKVWWML